MSCKHDCPKPPAFPKTIFNRPGLPRIDYRIGRYAEVRAHLFDGLNKAPVLAGWTHRGADDPGVALLEGDAIVIDILTFYQSLYANEAWLRTAQWRESVADIVRLGGYRLAPGVAGETTFALTVKGKLPVTVPAGFGLKAQIEGIDKPVEFETRDALEAWPALGLFNLYRPRVTPSLAAGATVIALGADAGDLAAGDRLMLSRVSPAGAANTRLLDPEVVTIAETWTEFDGRYARLEAPLRRSTAVATLRAYRLGESFRHFGHNSADTIATVSSQGVPSQRATSFARYGNVTTTADVTPDLTARNFPLDRGYERLVAGDIVLIQGRFSMTTVSTPQRFTIARRVSEAELRSITWGTTSGGATMLTLEQDLLVTDGVSFPYSDVRTLSALHVVGTPFDVRAQPVPTTASAGDDLEYFGTHDDARALEGRRLLLAYADGNVDERVVHAVTPGGSAEPTFHELHLSHPVQYAAFGYDAPTVGVYGNVVDASQGKTIAATPIGSGDARVPFQGFAIPKDPLTYLLDAAQTPAYAPELEIFVDDLRWERRDTLFGAGPAERVYIVREDADGHSFVQFGDGKTGARLSSGRNNVVATWRVGSGAHGALKPDTKPQATGRLTNLDKVFLPVEVDTGAPPEAAGIARRAAPVRLQSIGRLVSLADYEAETRMLPNVVKANARWDAIEGVAGIVITVLTHSGSEADTIAIRDALLTFNRCRGPNRHTLRVLRGHRQFVHVHATVGYDPAYLPEKLTTAIETALGVGGIGEDFDTFEGLFGLDRRDFRQSVHTSEILGAIQNVPGVAWATLQAAAPLALSTPPETDPANLPLPALDFIPAPAIACPARALLSLQQRHLVLEFVAAMATTECES